MNFTELEAKLKNNDYESKLPQYRKTTKEDIKFWKSISSKKPHNDSIAGITTPTYHIRGRDIYPKEVETEEYHTDQLKLDELFMSDLRECCNVEIGKIINDKEWEKLLDIVQSDDRVYRNDSIFFAIERLVVFFKSLLNKENK